MAEAGKTRQSKATPLGAPCVSVVYGYFLGLRKGPTKQTSPVSEGKGGMGRARAVKNLWWETANVCLYAGSSLNVYNQPVDAPQRR